MSLRSAVAEKLVIAIQSAAKGKQKKSTRQLTDAKEKPACGQPYKN
jgi:hypothetical protein